MFALILILFLAVSSESYPSHRSNDEYVYETFPFVSRSDWGARPPTSVIELDSPVPYVIIHHTYIPGACYSFEECSQSMRAMQNNHQLTQQWNDIGYNFAVGSDGAVYEGRGWTSVGAHAAGYNTVSIGIVLIGDWVSTLPPRHQLETTKKLIDVGVRLGYISPDYALIGHRQVRATECPGDALFQEITTWNSFQHHVIKR